MGTSRRPTHSSLGQKPDENPASGLIRALAIFEARRLLAECRQPRWHSEGDGPVGDAEVVSITPMHPSKKSQ